MPVNDLSHGPTGTAFDRDVPLGRAEGTSKGNAFERADVRLPESAEEEWMRGRYLVAGSRQLNSYAGLLEMRLHAEDLSG